MKILKKNHSDYFVSNSHFVGIIIHLYKFEN